MTNRRVVSWAVVVALLVSQGSAWAALPVIYTALRIGAQSYSLSKLAEAGQSLVGQAVKELDASLAPITNAITGAESTAVGVRIPLSTDASAAVPVPSAAATATVVYTVNNPGGVSPPEVFTSSTAAGAQAAACSGFTANKLSYCGATATGVNLRNQTLTGSTCNFQYQCVFSGSTGGWLSSSLSVTAVGGCPSGYTYSAGACNLTNARLTDAVADYSRSGTGFSVYSGDTCATCDWLSAQTITNTNDTLRISGMTSPTGVDVISRPMVISVQNTADGGSVLTTQVQRTDGSGATYTQTTTMTVSPASVVTAATVTNTAQALTSNAAGNSWTVGSAPTSSYAPAATAAAAQTITFPNDYARQGEAAAAASSINSTLGPKLDKLDTDINKITETGADPADPTVPGDTEWNDAFFKDTFTSLLGWRLPAHSSQCPVASFDFNGNTYSINSHCQLIADHFGTLSAAMAVVWTVIALFILLAA